MSETSISNILKSMTKISKEIEIINTDSRMKQLMDLTNLGGNGRLETVQKLYDQAKIDNEKWTAEVDRLNKRLKREEEELDKAKLACEQLKDGVTSAALMASVELIKKQIELTRDLITFCQQAMGVHLDFNFPENTISGYVLVDGGTTQHSSLETFVLENKSKNEIIEEIWRKIELVTDDFSKNNVSNSGSEKYVDK